MSGDSWEGRLPDPCKSSHNDAEVQQKQSTGDLQQKQIEYHGEDEIIFPSLDPAAAVFPEGSQDKRPHNPLNLHRAPV